MKSITLAAASIFTLTLLNGAPLSDLASSRAAPTKSDTAVTEFSADAVQALPGREIQTGKLYVSKSGTRFEFQQRGRPIVQVALPAQGIIRILFPLERRYMELKSKPGTAMPPLRSGTPCKTSAQLKCEQLGKTTINGLSAQRWRVTTRRPMSELRIWWDATRKIALRQEYADGRIMQATMRGMQKFEDRDVESWEFVYTAPNGRYRRAMSLIAPDLGLAVIEQLPNGATRRLHNIKVGTPDASLFELPKGYKRITHPRARSRPSAAAKPLKAQSTTQRPGVQPK